MNDKTVAEMQDIIPLYRFTKEAWEGIGKPRNQWESENFPYSFCSPVYRYESEHDVENASYIQIVLGEEYLQWLKENKRRHSHKSMETYAMQLHESDTSRIARKEGMDKDYALYMLPVAVMDMQPGSHSLRLTDYVKNELLSYLESVYGKGSIYLPGCIVNDTVAESDYNSFFEEAKNWACGHSQCIHFGWNIQNAQYMSATILCIPYVHVLEHYSMVTTLDDVDEEQIYRNGDYVFMEDALEQDYVHGVHDMISMDFYPALIACFESTNLISCDRAYYWHQRNIMEKDFKEMIRQMQGTI